MKLCTVCLEEKSREEFYFSVAHNGKKYPNSCCKLCNAFRQKKYRGANIEKAREYEKSLRLKLQTKILNYYGNKCINCDATERLEIDHINNDGNEFREEFGKGCSKSYYYWIIRNNFPDDLQILCRLCNIRKRFEYERQTN